MLEKLKNWIKEDIAKWKGELHYTVLVIVAVGSSVFILTTLGLSYEEAGIRIAGVVGAICGLEVGYELWKRSKKKRDIDEKK